MKKITCILLFCFAVHAYAATSITTPKVSGHWTASGSPYDVYNDIMIDPSYSLTIDPGVNVVFHGAYRLQVYGILHASGTISAPINFNIADTTGFSTDNSTNAGGWRGVQFFTYGGTGTDTSALNYCNITHAKLCALDAVVWRLNILTIMRALVVSNCNFYNSSTTIGCGIDLAYIALTSGQRAELNNCNFYSNFSDGSLLHGDGGNIYIHDSRFYQNLCTINTLGIISSDFLFSNNELYHNTINGPSGGEGIFSLFSDARLIANKIHHNICRKAGVICGNSGFIDIISNVICNNQHTDLKGCGITDGAGALNLAWNSSSTHSNTFYNVRNNIIANNYSPFEAGAIKIYQANAVITNNQIVNNASPNGAALSLFDNQSSVITIKNNVFYGNVEDTTIGTPTPAIQAYFTGTTFKYEYNWAQYPTKYELDLLGTYTLTGDTTTNIVGINPGMISPTPAAKLGTDATLARFALSATSPCIDKGDTTGTIIEAKDYAGNARIYGTKIDIGASEYSPFNALDLTYTPAEKQVDIYPNPVKGIVYVTTPEAKGQISMIDLSGKLLQLVTVTNTSSMLDVHTTAPGIYFIVWTNDGSPKEIQKVVVE
ncbi:MAG: parallel beta-helix repeat-containing protein [Flavipsychrobacter sp.]|nr:parallel beta-helix repeat-containing protein [Flavipsychrobacter sp.]